MERTTNAVESQEIIRHTDQKSPDWYQFSLFQPALTAKSYPQPNKPADEQQQL